MAKELRHFMTFQNGATAHARVDFSDLCSVVQVRLTLDMEIPLGMSNQWDNFIDDVRDMLRYANNPNQVVNAHI